MPESLTVSPTRDPRTFRAADGSLLSAPPSWGVLPPGDAGLTRRVKALGPSWVVVEMKGRKRFSLGLWAPADHIEQARAEIEATRADPAHQKKLDASRRRRERAQDEYVVNFEREVHAFLRFAPAFAAQGQALAQAVTAHATPVGSGTVARTARIEIDRRAEAAVIAWMRHQTTAYDGMSVPRVRGARRAVRRELAEVSRALLDLHRGPARHDLSACPLCAALPRPAAEPEEARRAG
jgi:hypothetical protein